MFEYMDYSANRLYYREKKKEKEICNLFGTTFCAWINVAMLFGFQKSCVMEAPTRQNKGTLHSG